MKRLKTSDSGNFRGKTYFEIDGTQNFLVFQPIHKYFVYVISRPYSLVEWKSKVPYTDNNFLGPLLDYLGNKIQPKFSGDCLKQDKFTYNHGKIINVYIVYEISKNNNINTLPTLANCLFGAVSLIKNADIDKYKYSGYGIAFDRHGSFSHPCGGTGKNIKNFGVHMSSATKIDNTKKYTSILGKGPT